MVAVSKAQAFVMERVERSKLEGAPYNPRAITNIARKRLEERLRKTGLVMPLVWNRRTGHLVAGHQRLAILDRIQGGKPYALDVAVIDVDEKAEAELVVFLNNPSAQGHWDGERLEKLVRGGMSWAGAGFDALELQTLIDAPDLAGMFSDGAQTPEALALLASVEETAAAAAEVKERRAQQEAIGAERIDKGHIAVVVFPSRKARDVFLRRVGGDPASQYVDGARVVAQLAPEEQ